MRIIRTYTDDSRFNQGLTVFNNDLLCDNLVFSFLLLDDWLGVLQLHKQILLEPVPECHSWLLKLYLNFELEISLAQVHLLVDLEVIDPDFGRSLNFLAFMVAVAHLENTRFELRGETCQVHGTLGAIVRPQVHSRAILEQTELQLEVDALRDGDLVARVQDDISVGVSYSLFLLLGSLLGL